MNFSTLDYETFRRIANGMNYLMALYSLLNYFKNRNLTFLLYSIILFSSTLDYYIFDQYHLKGQTKFVTIPFAVETTCLNIILYCVFVIKTFDKHIQEKLFFKRVYSIILILLLTILMDYIVKVNNCEYLAPWVYGIATINNLLQFIFIFKILYKQTFSFMKYYIIGSILITFGWALKCIFQIYPAYFSSIITFERSNPFSFPNTYGQLGIIFESIFIFIAISESHKLLELSKIDLRRKILLSVEERNNDDKTVIEIKQRILMTVIATFSKNQAQSEEVIQDALKALNIGDNLMAKTKLILIHNISSESIQIIRHIVRKFNEQNELILNKSIESKAYEISKYHLTPKHITFTLYVNDSEKWHYISNEFEEHILILYENLLKIFIKYKDILHLMITLSINEEGDLFLVIQDDGNSVKAKTKMIRDLNLMLPDIKKWQGEIIYAIEDNEESIVKVHFMTETKS